MINSFSTNVPLLYPLKTLENLRFSDVFRGYRSGTLVENELINDWTFQWKMQFNPDGNKQAQKLYFSKQAGNEKSLDLAFNKNNVASTLSVKHLDMLFDSRLNFTEHVQSKKNK